MKNTKNQPMTMFKKRIAVTVLKALKELPDGVKSFLYVTESDSELAQLMAKKSNIDVSRDSRESGMVAVAEYISITMDDIEQKVLREQRGDKPRNHRSGFRHPEWNVSEVLKLRTKKFERDNIKPSGPCDTTIGEIFRALQRIEYRAMNDGDNFWEIGSPSFPSYVYMMSMIDKLNWSSEAYNSETGKYEYTFEDEVLQKSSWEGKISDRIESFECFEAEFIRYQLVDLMKSGQLKDYPNEYDLRYYSTIKKDK